MYKNLKALKFKDFRYCMELITRIPALLNILEIIFYVLNASDTKKIYFVPKNTFR